MQLQTVVSNCREGTDSVRCDCDHGTLCPVDHIAGACECADLHHGHLLHVHSERSRIFVVVLVLSEFKLKCLLKRFNLLSLSYGKSVYCLM